MTKILSNKSNIDLDYPICRPSLDLDFTQEVLDPRITFSRGSIGTRVNRNRLIETVSTNLPRFDYDPVTGECKGLLIEESRSNLLVRSEDFSLWSVSNGSVQSNVITAPDGNTTADKLVENSSTGNKEVSRSSITFTSGTSLTFSCFVKAGERNLFRFGFTTGFFASTTEVHFNLTSGTVSSTFGGVTSASIIPYPNGWYRCVATVLPTSSGTGLVYITLVRSGIQSNYVGDGTSGLYLWGAQLEAGAFPTSYIPTTASTVTRSADNAQMTGTNFSSWYNSSEGTIYTQAKSIATISGATRRFLEFVNGSGTERYLLGYSTTSSARFLVTALGVNQADISVTASPSNGVKMCVSYATNNFSSAVNGTLGTRDVAGLVSNPIKITFGSDPFLNANTILSGTISRLTYYPRALKPNQLQYLTQ